MKLTRLHTLPYTWFVEVDKTTPAVKCQQLLAPTSLVTYEILLFAALWLNYLANGEKYLILFSFKICQPKCSSFIIIWSMGWCLWKVMPFIDLQARLLPPAVTRRPLTCDLPLRLSPPRGQCEIVQQISEVEMHNLNYNGSQMLAAPKCNVLLSLWVSVCNQDINDKKANF